MSHKWLINLTYKVNNVSKINNDDDIDSVVKGPVALMLLKELHKALLG